MSTQNTHGGRLTGAVRTAGVGAYAAPNVSQNLSVSYVPTVNVWWAHPFKPEKPQYKGYLTACLPVGSSDTLKLNRVAQQTLTQIYKSGYAYKKCGVVLMGIESANTQMQLDWLNPPDSDERKSLMHTIDALNQRFGRHSIRTADQDAAGNNAGWRMKRERLSPCYTTQFTQLLQVG